MTHRELTPLIELDAYLTGQPMEYAERNALRARERGFDWREIYYLSDGGISRLGFHKGRLYLTANSSPDVLAQWETERGRALRAALESLLNATRGKQII